jgi:hypothetical protein
VIAAVVRGDRPLSVGTGAPAAIHYADLRRARCPRAVKTNRYAMDGGDRTFAVGRCVLDRGHDEPCREGKPGSRPLPRTLCDTPMREAEAWVPIDVRPSDRVCGPCAARLGGAT